MVRILPGVEIDVVKEIVPQQLAPSGIVGMIGTAEQGPVMEQTPVTSYREFADKFGSNPAYSLTKEVKQAFQNGVFEIFVTRIEGSGGQRASLKLKAAKRKDTVHLESKLPGETGNKVDVRIGKGTADNSVLIEIGLEKKVEVFDNLVMDSSSENYLVNVVNEKSQLVAAEDLKAPNEFPDNNPLEVESKLEGGVTGAPKVEDYEKALERLEMEPDIEMVLACDVTDTAVWAVVDAHCKNMSKDAKNRIGIGTAPSQATVKDIVKMTETLASDRFVVCAPYGVSGAVCGLASKLKYYESPTFKALTGIADIERRYTPAEQMELLKAGILVVDVHRGRGIIVVKGISTSKEQISVTRIADHAVRGTNNVADNFIGTLNSPGGRMALREKITEFFLSMEKEGAIVPSTDGKQPSFLVDVYSSQLDFAQGIVRVDIAVRPVRAMDYIYATITVQA